MKCPKCGWEPKIKDIRLLGFHIITNHEVPKSVAVNILKRLGFEEELRHYGLLEEEI